MIVIYHHHHDIYGDVVNDQTVKLWTLSVDDFGFEVILPLRGHDGSDAAGLARYSMTCDGVH